MDLKFYILLYVIGLAVDEAILALWMIFWRGLVSFAVEPFGLCILKPLLPLTATLEGVSIFITVSLGEVGYFSDPFSNQNSLIILHENSILTYFSDFSCRQNQMTTEFLKSVGNAIDLKSGLRNSQLQLLTRIGTIFCCLPFEKDEFQNSSHHFGLYCISFNRTSPTFSLVVWMAH